MEEKITVTRTQVRRFGLIMMILITILGALHQWQYQSDKKEALKNAEILYKKEQQQAVLRERKAVKKSDSIYNISRETKEGVFLLKNEVAESIKQDKIQNDRYQKSIISLNKIKNEKIIIPNATLEQQVDFLSKYKYEPF